MGVLMALNALHWGLRPGGPVSTDVPPEVPERLRAAPVEFAAVTVPEPSVEPVQVATVEPVLPAKRGPGRPRKVPGR